jgi:hypothetical protein
LQHPAEVTQGLSNANTEVPAIDDALRTIRDRHRAERAEAKPPLAPLNVDVPLALLQHLRALSADIPYPLRRLTQEALELWLVATGNTSGPTRKDIP